MHEYTWSPDQLQWRSVIDERGRKVIRREDGETWAFDTFADACEGSRSSPAHADLTAELDRWAERESAEAFVERFGAGGGSGASSSDLEQLTELGYPQ